MTHGRKGERLRLEEGEEFRELSRIDTEEEIQDVEGREGDIDVERGWYKVAGEGAGV